MHKEECTQTSNYCSGAGYTGKEIEYGRLGSGDEPVSGDAFDCDVNGDGEYNTETERFYYVSDLYIGNNNETNEPEFDSNYAVLIYYNNTYNGEPNNTSSSLIAYYGAGAENWHGPVTAIGNLPTINQWSNVSLYSTDRTILNEKGEATTDNGTNALPDESNPFSYTKDGTDLAARLLTTQELEKACGIKVGPVGLNTCNYLLENTKYSNSLLGTQGYWFETPVSTQSLSIWNLYVIGPVVGYSGASGTSEFGLRPVIEVLKSDIDF